MQSMLLVLIMPYLFDNSYRVGCESIFGPGGGVVVGVQ